MDDLFLLETTSNESMRQLFAAQNAGEVGRQASLDRRGMLSTMRTASRRVLVTTMGTAKSLIAGGAPAPPPPSPLAPVEAEPPPLPPPLRQPNKRQRAEIEGATGSPIAFTTAIYNNGNLYANSMLYALLGSFYYCPMSSAVLSELLAPSVSRGGSIVARVDVPPRLSRQTYAQLAEELRVSHDAAAIGLHRYGIPARDGPDGPSYYTLVCPPPDTVLYSAADGHDYVFVLAHKSVVFSFS